MLRATYSVLLPCLLAFPAAFGAGGAGSAWCFTNGIPQGVSLGESAAVSAAGLYPLQITNVSSGAGCKVGWVKLPDAFRLEAEIAPAIAWGDGRTAAKAASRDNVLFDNLYVPLRKAGLNRGITVNFRSRGNMWTPEAFLGFGDDVVKSEGPEVRIEPGKPVRFAFSFDAARGVAWEFAGERKECTIPRSGPLAQSEREASIGERGCSNYRTFNGRVLSLSVLPAERRHVAAGPTGRAAFVRGETNAVLEIAIEDFRAGRKFVRRIPVETRVRPGMKSAIVEHEGLRFEIPYRIGPRSAPRMPVVAWQGGPAAHVRKMGFTHLFDFNLGSRMPREKPGRLEEAHAILDNALAEGLKMISFASTGLYSDSSLPPRYCRLKRQWKGSGVPKGRRMEPEVSSPYIQELARLAAKGNAEDFGRHPALGGVLCNTERMDRAFPSFNSEDALYESETGLKIPDEIDWRIFGLKKASERFPDGIVPDDDPVLGFYRW